MKDRPPASLEVGKGGEGGSVVDDGDFWGGGVQQEGVEGSFQRGRQGREGGREESGDSVPLHDMGVFISDDTLRRLRHVGPYGELIAHGATHD